MLSPVSTDVITYIIAPYLHASAAVILTSVAQVELLDRTAYTQPHCITKNVLGYTIHYRNGKVHNDEGPAAISPDDDEHWFCNGVRHRVGGPAIIIRDLIDTKPGRYWYQHGKKHRVDGPAIEYISGGKEWWQHGERHREGGLPAIEYADGSKEWYRHGKRYNNTNWSRYALYATISMIICGVIIKCRR